MIKKSKNRGVILEDIFENYESYSSIQSEDEDGEEEQDEVVQAPFSEEHHRLIGNKMYFKVPRFMTAGNRYVEVSLVSTKEDYNRYHALKFIAIDASRGTINEAFLSIEELLADDHELSIQPSAVIRNGQWFEWDRGLTEKHKIKICKTLAAYISLWV